jgi:hypothetical protein
MQAKGKKLLFAGRNDLLYGHGCLHVRGEQQDFEAWHRFGERAWKFATLSKKANLQ